MELNIGNERIMALHARYSADHIREKAMAKRIEAFGVIAKFIQRVQPDDIKIATFQKRFEPFWFVAASSHYVYDRRHKYHVEVVPKVHAVTVHDNKYPVMGNSFELEAVNHCTEEFKRELIVDAMNGNEVDLKKYLNYPKSEVPDIAALNNEGTIVVPPEILSSYVVRKMVLQLIKTIQADAVMEENINISEITLFYRPVYAIEYLWKDKNKKKVVEFDALTGEAKFEAGAIKKQFTKALENNTFFDFSADAAGTLIPGANLVVKLGRMAAKKVVE